MNREEAAQFLPLVQALAEGKTIQIYSAGTWRDLDSPSFATSIDLYRVKPEPAISVSESTGRGSSQGTESCRQGNVRSEQAAIHSQCV